MSESGAPHAAYNDAFAAVDPALLAGFAKRYVWWKSPDEALEYPQRVLAQVMDIGTMEDLTALWTSVDYGTLRKVIASAQAGQFRPRSWRFWHVRLGLLAAGEDAPPLPTRRIP